MREPPNSQPQFLHLPHLEPHTLRRSRVRVQLHQMTIVATSIWRQWRIDARQCWPVDGVIGASGKRDRQPLRQWQVWLTLCPLIFYINMLFSDLPFRYLYRYDM